MPDVLMYADTFRSPELRHEVPLGIPDPFLYVEKDGVKHIAIGAMEIPRLAALGLFELHPCEEFGARRADRRRARPTREIRQRDRRCARSRRSGSRARSCRRRSRSGSPTGCAPTGVELTVDGDFFDDRRRVKTDAELAGHPPRAARGRGRHGRGARPACAAPSRTAPASCSTASR